MTKQRTELTVLEEISKKLDKLTAVFAAQGKDEGTQIKIYEAAGMTSDEIGRCTGKAAATIRTRKHKRKKKKMKKRRKSK